MRDVALVAAVAALTFGFRVIPVLVPSRSVDHRRHTGSAGTRAVRDLELLPLAVLAALIVPGVFRVDPDNWAVGAGAAAAALLVTTVRRHPPLPVVIFASVTSALFVLYLSGGL